METKTTSGSPRRFCSECGTKLDPSARFCHECGEPVGGAAAAAPGRSAADRSERAGPVVGGVGKAGVPAVVIYGVPAVAAIVVLVLVAFQIGSRGGANAGAVPLGAMGQAPDISSMSPEERADRLFNRVMRLASEGHADSAAFFGPMALNAFEALAPLTAHMRYDMGLIGLVSGDPALARAQADTILAARPTHLLGLALAARAAEARGDAAAAAAFRRRLVQSETAERAADLPEYTDHDNDIRDAIQIVRGNIAGG